MKTEYKKPVSEITAFGIDCNVMLIYSSTEKQTIVPEKDAQDNSDIFN